MKLIAGISTLHGRPARGVHTPRACVTLEPSAPRELRRNCAGRNNLLTNKPAARYKGTSSSREDQDADEQDPDH